MKPLLIAVGVAGLLLGQVSSSEAQQSERVYPFVELTDEDVALIDIKDGSIDDWLEVVGEPSVTALDFPYAYSSYDPFSMDFRVWLAWHDATNRIYVAMERSDDSYINEFQRGCTNCGNRGYMFNQDSAIIFYVDGDRSGGEYLFWDLMVEDEEEFLLLHYQQAQEYVAIGETHDTGTHTMLLHSGAVIYGEKWCSYSPYSEGGGGALGENPTISVTEFYVTPFDRYVWNRPEESLISELYPGKMIGFVIEVPDWDIGWDTAGFNRYTLIGEEWIPQTPREPSDIFAVGLLLGPGGEMPEISAVESITWGRIKAQFVD